MENENGEFLIVDDEFYEKPVIVRVDRKMPSGRLWVDYGHGMTSLSTSSIVGKLNLEQSERVLQEHQQGNMYGFAIIKKKD